VARLNWSPEAREDLRAIRRYIGQSSRRHAETFIARIIAAAERLQVFPLSGRVVPDDDLGEHREIFLSDYRIVYHIAGDEVRIDTVVHGARRLPELPET